MNETTPKNTNSMNRKELCDFLKSHGYVELQELRYRTINPANMGYYVFDTTKGKRIYMGQSLSHVRMFCNKILAK